MFDSYFVCQFKECGIIYGIPLPIISYKEPLILVERADTIRGKKISKKMTKSKKNMKKVSLPNQSKGHCSFSALPTEGI